MTLAMNCVKGDPVFVRLLDGPHKGMVADLDGDFVSVNVETEFPVHVHQRHVEHRVGYQVPDSGVVYWVDEFGPTSARRLAEMAADGQRVRTVLKGRAGVDVEPVSVANLIDGGHPVVQLFRPMSDGSFAKWAGTRRYDEIAELRTEFMAWVSGTDHDNLFAALDERNSR